MLSPSQKGLSIALVIHQHDPSVCGTRVFLVERIIPTGMMARYQVTLDIALRWSATIGRITILLTLHSAGVQDVENMYRGH